VAQIDACSHLAAAHMGGEARLQGVGGGIKDFGGGDGPDRAAEQALDQGERHDVAHGRVHEAPGKAR
jgi:hypothetical protein